ncbi:hypothetical protein PN499_22515 [Kamptonema animale CS-326]|nr:hypothetical protein [Kamptonema animale]MDB9513976.1 hypothetical protein [Kamptonema animale CS-326]
MRGDKDKFAIAWLVGIALFMVGTLVGLKGFSDRRRLPPQSSNHPKF